MKKALLIIRQELRTTFQRKLFLAVAFGIPLLLVLVAAGARFIRGRSPAGSPASASNQAYFQLAVEGFVDQSGLVSAIPGNLPKSRLLPFQSEEQAKQALISGDITAYYLIPPDYVEQGEIFYVYPDTKPLIADGQDWVMRWTLVFNLAGGDEKAADRIWNPVWSLESTSLTSQARPSPPSGDDCTRPSFTCRSNELVRFLPVVLMVLFFVSLMTSSSMLLNSIASEKENRTIEVLLVSIHPRQLLSGKTIGLGIAGLLQTIAWLGAIYLSMKLGGQVLHLPESFSLPVDILIWSMVFFLGGYAMYACLIAGAGALVANTKEASAVNSILMLPLFIGYFVGLVAPIAGTVNEGLPVVLSIFPPTAPVVMVMRLANGVVPLWQLLLAAALVYLNAGITLYLAAGLFRAQYLLSGQAFSLGRYLKVLFHPGAPVLHQP